MEQRNKKGNHFIMEVLALFAVNILLLILITALFGDGAKDLSPIYQFGSKGLALSTMLQFLLSSVLIILYMHICFSVKVFKKMMALWRTVLLLVSVFITEVAFIIVFDWFPLNDAYAWAGFLICFGGGFLIGIISMIIKTKLENRRYNQLLSVYKDQHKGDGKDESSQS